MSYASIGVPGTPEWWLNRLVARLVERTNRYDLLENYFLGNHPLPNGDARYVKALNALRHQSRTNMVGMATGAVAERMRVDMVRINGEVDKEATEIWSANNMDFQAPKLFLTAAALGDTYIMVSPSMSNDPLSSGLPVITVEDPRVCITEEDPANTQVTLAAVRMWADDVTQQMVAILYLPETIHYYAGPLVSDCKGLDTPGLTQRLMAQSGSGFQETSVVPNPIGVVPITRAAWKPSFKGASMAECEDALDIQDRINSTTLDRMVISRSQAYKQRWASGIRIPKAKDGAVKPPFDPGADHLWITSDENAKFGEFTEADIRQVIEAVDADIAQFAMVTKTPPHYLMGKVANVSGSTLTQAEAGLTSKCRQRQIAMGWALERTHRIAFLYMGSAKAKAVDFEVVWGDSERQSRAELADAFQKEVAAGLPLDIAALRLGLSADHLELVKEHMVKLEEQEEQARQDELKVAQQKAAQPTQNPSANRPAS